MAETKLDPYSIVKHPVSTEKAVRLMEKDNKLTFVVNRKASKPEIRKALEQIYKIKILNVNTILTSKGIKKAYVKLHKDAIALDIATQIGIM